MFLEDRQRRKFLGALCVSIIPVLFAAPRLHAQQDAPSPRARIGDRKPGEEDDAALPPPGSRKAALEENEKDLKKKVEKLFQLATDLKNEVDKTDSVKVLSITMLKKADEIEKLAKDIKNRAKG